jgi:hypothetical protein
MIAVMDAKYKYAFWRPITAIRNGDIDRNDATERDVTWQPIDNSSDSVFLFFFGFGAKRLVLEGANLPHATDLPPIVGWRKRQAVVNAWLYLTERLLHLYLPGHLSELLLRRSIARRARRRKAVPSSLSHGLGHLGQRDTFIERIGIAETG